MKRSAIVQAMVDEFLSWPLPDSVSSDLCATVKNTPHRSGTTLLTADEAKQLFDRILNVVEKQGMIPPARDADLRSSYGYARIHEWEKEDEEDRST